MRGSELSLEDIFLQLTSDNAATVVHAPSSAAPETPSQEDEPSEKE